MQGPPRAGDRKEGFLFRFGGEIRDLSARTHIMGILNVTPDSFSDGGMYGDPPRALDRALEMVAEGADFVDVGGESTRPRGTAYGEGARPVSAAEELGRILPVLRLLGSRLEVPVSVDTYKAEVAEAALDAGAVIVNDISGFGFDPRMPEVVARAGATAVLMHTKAMPSGMPLQPRYDDLWGEILGFLSEAVSRAGRAGVLQVLVDPGLGFGKTVEHNLAVIAGLPRLARLGRPVLAGPSRKSFVGAVLDLPVGDRLEGSLAAAVACVLGGAHVLRVHDVGATRRAVLLADAIRRVAV
ncbi:MAG: dihydropteroate synthase [Bacteroidota bacterium]